MHRIRVPEKVQFDALRYYRTHSALRNSIMVETVSEVRHGRGFQLIEANRLPWNRPRRKK